MIYRQNIHSCTDCAKRLSSFSVMRFRYLRCMGCGGAWLSHATLLGMFTEMRAGARVELKTAPKKTSEAVMLAFNVSDGAQLVLCEDPVIKIGRLASCQLRLDHPSVDRTHCVIEFKAPDNIAVIDLGSERGTKLNGKLLTAASLHDGDLLQIGIYSVEVTVLEKNPHENEASARACVECRAPGERYHLMGVEVDVCKSHGAWFDAEELQTVLHRLTN